MSAPDAYARWAQTPQEPGHEHDLAVTLERGLATIPGHARITVSCRACGWGMTYEGAVPWCGSAQAHVCGQDTREAGSRVTAQCALPAGHAGPCAAQEEG